MSRKGNRKSIKPQHRYLIPTKVIGLASLSDMETIGFSFGEELNPLLRECILPTGWTELNDKTGLEPKDETTNALYDQHGNKRAIIDSSYNKDGELINAIAVFYTRYTIVKAVNEGIIEFSVFDRVSGETKSFCQLNSFERPRHKFLKACENASCDIKSWIAEKFPDWENPLAYWD